MARVTVYSCVTGGIDELSVLLDSPLQPQRGVRWVLFTDTPLHRVLAGRRADRPLVWQIHPPLWSHSEPRRVARCHKVLAHRAFPETDYSIWIDGTQEILPGFCPEEFATRVLCGLQGTCYQIAAFCHPQRTCVYQELEACLRLKKDHPALMRAQVQRYREEGYPQDHGMVETTCVCRQHTKDVLRFNTLWWQEIQQGSCRDQLSFNYVAWKLGMAYGTIPGCRDRSPYFRFHSHKTPR